MIIRTTTLVVCVLCFAAPQLTVAAESEDLHPYLESKFSLDLGVYFPDRELNLRVNGSLAGDNDEIDFDNRTRLRRADETFATEFSWRFHERWSVIGQYFKSSGTTSVVLQEDVEWEDVVFGAGSNASVGSNFSLTRIFFGRRLETGESREIGIGAGLHRMHIGAFIAGEILVNGTPTAARRSVHDDAVLPNIGAWYKVSISPRWAVRTRLDLLSASIGDYRGLLLNAAVGVNYQAFEHVGFGLNYNYFELDIKIDKSAWRGKIETVYHGIYANVSIYY